MPRVDVSRYFGKEPVFNPQDYFNGPLKAWGLVQDRAGRVRRRFDLDLHGSWVGDTCTLTERFHYYDGEVLDRVWTIICKPDGAYEGRAPDVIGTAPGRMAGFAANWNYMLELAADGKKHRISFDDWMFQMNDGVLINRVRLKKFGFKVGELTIFMQKQ